MILSRFLLFLDNFFLAVLGLGVGLWCTAAPPFCWTSLGGGFCALDTDEDDLIGWGGLEGLKRTGMLTLFPVTGGTTVGSMT